MPKKYEVSVRFTRKVSRAGLANAVKSAAGAKLKGFKPEGLSTHESFEEQKPMPVRVVKRKKK